ncbi:MAG: MFS transporter [Pseudomonadota bacterium]
MSPAPSASPAAPLGLGQRLGYSAGTLALSVKDLAFTSFVLFYYVSVVGLSGSLAGLVLLLAMFWDAVTDPIVGALSDNLRSRWGRRHPFMAVSGVPLAICLYALFNVPDDLGQTGIFMWMLCVTLLLRTFLTLFTVPYLALGAELSTDYHERTVITGTRTVVYWLSVVLMGAVAFGVFFARDGADGGDGRLVRDNYWLYGVFCAAVVLVFTAVATWATATHIPRLRQNESQTPFRLAQIARDLIQALSNNNFRNLFWMLLVIGAATGLTSALNTHLNTYFWELSQQQITWALLSTVLPVLAMSALMRRLNRQLEKQQALLWASVLLGANAMWLIPGRLLGLMPDNGSDALFALILLQGWLSIATIIWFQTVSASLIADIADEQELRTGKRQEGVFFAAQGFAQKVPSGLGNFFGGIVLDVIRLPVGAQPGSVGSEVLFGLGLVMGPLVGILLLTGILFARAIRTSRERHGEVRAALDAKASAGVIARLQEAPTPAVAESEQRTLSAASGG